MRRIVETHSHSRGSQSTVMAMFSSPKRLEYRNNRQGLYPPHTDKVTVTGTGTLQPSSCGKGPKAAGQSVMMLPGNPDGDAARLMCKGHDLSVWGQSRCSSLRTGRPSTWRRAAVQGAVGIPWMRSSRLLPLMARTSIGPHREKSVCKDSLGGKAGCGESRPSGLGGGFSKPLKGNF
jgi:hypothetical protein